LLDLQRMGGSSRLLSLGVSWEWTRMTPAGPEMKMKLEEDLHLVALRLAACELH
jgi:hypothetical protein